jgi:hypothetical protein
MKQRIKEQIDRFLEWSSKRKARKQFDKSKLKYTDGDNT